MTTNLPHDGKRMCGAKTRAGTPCQQTAGWGTDHVGDGRCKLHGGKSLGGIVSPRYTHGRYTKYIPARLIERYKEGVSDNQLLVLADEIALIDSRLSDLLSRVDSGESGKLWRDLVKEWQELKAAVRQGDRVEQSERAASIDAIMNKARNDYLAWGEIHGILEQRRKLVESERKRLVEIQQTITAKEAMTLIAALLGIIKDNVTDRDTLQRISTAVNGLIAAKV